MIDTVKLLQVRRSLVELMEKITEPKLTEALALLTEGLLQEGVKSLGDVGKRVWVWGRGEGIITYVNYPEQTRFTIVLSGTKTTLKNVLKEGFDYYELR